MEGMDRSAKGIVEYRECRKGGIVILSKDCEAASTSVIVRQNQVRRPHAKREGDQRLEST